MEKDQVELLKIITSFLEKSKISYLITGAWSSIFYGRPRASHDIDFVVELYETDIKRTIIVINELGRDFLVQADDINRAVLKKSSFNILYLPTALKLDFWVLKNEEFANSMFIRRRKVKLFNKSMFMASPEDTILQKLRWYKLGKIEKHLIDAAFVYQIQKNNLDKKYLKKWVKKLRVEKYFKELGSINLENYL